MTWMNTIFQKEKLPLVVKRRSHIAVPGWRPRILDLILLPTHLQQRIWMIHHHMKVLKDLLSMILVSPEAEQSIIFQKDISSSKMQGIFVETCELESKAADEKKQKAVSSSGGSCQ
jgi:hypothetical protein